MSFGGEELFKEGNNLRILFVDLARKEIGGGGSGGRRLGLARSEAETRVGLFATAGGFVENGAVDFGDQNVVVVVGGGKGGCIGRGRRAEREREEFGLREEAEVD